MRDCCLSRLGAIGGLSCAASVDPRVRHENAVASTARGQKSSHRARLAVLGLRTDAP